MQDEKILKRFLKRRCKVTLAFVTAFLITGSLTMASEADPLFPKDKDTEVVFFLNGALGSGELESVRNIGEVKLLGYDNSIKPPIEWTPIEPSTPVEPKPEVIPGLDIIKPGEPGGPTTIIPGIEIIPPGQEGGPTTKPVEPEKPQENINTENKVQENGIVFDIKENETFTNKGSLTLKSDTVFKDIDDDGVYDFPATDAFVIKNNGGIVLNEGIIKLEGMINTELPGQDNSVIIKTGEGVGVYQVAGNFTNNGDILLSGNGSDTHTGNDVIESKGGIGIWLEGGTVTNNGNILGKPDPNLIRPMGVGIKVLGGEAINGEEGIISNMHYGMSVEGKGTVTNYGTIKESVYGIEALIGGTAINYGTIEGGEKEALYVATNSKGINMSSGVINGNVAVESFGTITNQGTINGNATISTGGTFKNEGTLTGKEINLDETGRFIQDSKGKIEAEKFNGDIHLAGSYAENNFNDKIAVNGNISIKEHNGEIKSDSIMYDYNSTDKTLERKEFSELLNNKNIASYLENNYMDGDLIRQELYNNLKDINTVKEFNRATNNLFGNDIYPALNKQTLEMVRFNKDTLYSQIFNQDTDKDTRIIAGADYKTFDVDSSNLSGYDTDIQSVFIGMDKQMSANNRLGGIINVGKMKSSFEMNNAERDDMFVQANLYNIYQNNGYRLVNNLFVGATDGDLERDLKFGDVYGRQTADIDSTYIGLNNVLTRKFDFNSFYITPKLEANFTQLMNSEIKEDGNYGLEIEKQDVTSIEAGVGIEIGKEFMLTDTLKAGVKLSGTYLAELSDPYEEVNVRLRQINHSEFVKISEYDNEDYKDISLRLELSNDSISSYAEYKYMFDDSIGTLGVSYKF